MDERSFSPLSRRSFLNAAGGGFGGLALASMLAEESSAANPAGRSTIHHPPRAKHVIQLFMLGGASQCDLFDYKPALASRNGQTVDFGIKASATGSPGPLLKSPWKWQRSGQCGRWTTDLIPHTAKCVDDMAFLMAMASATSEHSAGQQMQTSGFIAPGHPSVGAWVAYALGSMNKNLPDYVALPDPAGLPWTGKAAWTNGYLPASHQGAMLLPSGANPVPDLFAPKGSRFQDADAQREGLSLLDRMNRRHLEKSPGDSRLEARIASYELAARLQLSIPETLGVGGESRSVHQLYGLDDPKTAGFGRNCLIARRLVERGVRFVQVWSGTGLNGASGNWDNHGDVGPGSDLERMARSVDRPIAALLTDLKSRGLLDETVVYWTTEFGRTPFSQGSKGRDHNGETFVSWMAGGGIKGGVSYGESDEFSYKAAIDKTMCYDQHATLLYLLGIDHEKLTVRHNGADRRLTDVHGRVVREVLS